MKKWRTQAGSLVSAKTRAEAEALARDLGLGPIVGAEKSAPKAKAAKATTYYGWWDDLSQSWEGVFPSLEAALAAKEEVSPSCVIARFGGPYNPQPLTTAESKIARRHHV